MVEIFPWDFYTRVGSCQELADCSQTDPVTGFGGGVLVQQIPMEILWRAQRNQSY